MNERSLRSLLAHRRPLLQAWETLLRAAPVNSALAHPDTLVHMMNRTLDEVFKNLTPQGTTIRHAPKAAIPLCRCGHNPLTAYFATAFMAFQQSLAQCADETPITREDVDAVNRTLSRIAHREISVLCKLCLLQPGLTPAGKDTACPASADSQTPAV